MFKSETDYSFYIDTVAAEFTRYQENGFVYLRFVGVHPEFGEVFSVQTADNKPTMALYHPTITEAMEAAKLAKINIMFH